MEGFIIGVILLLISSGILSLIFYILSIFSLMETMNGENRKKKGIAFIVLGTVFAYVPLEYLLGISISRIGMGLLIVIDCIMIYEFVKYWILLKNRFLKAF